MHMQPQKDCRACVEDKYVLLTMLFLAHLVYCVQLHLLIYLAHEEALSGNRCRYVAGNLGRQAVDRARKIQKKPWIRFSRQNILVWRVSDKERAMDWRLCKYNFRKQEFYSNDSLITSYPPANQNITCEKKLLLSHLYSI